MMDRMAVIAGEAHHRCLEVSCCKTGYIGSSTQASLAVRFGGDTSSCATIAALKGFAYCPTAATLKE